MNPIRYDEICSLFDSPDPRSVEARMRLHDLAEKGLISREAFDFMKDVTGPQVEEAAGIDEESDNYKAGYTAGVLECRHALDRI